MLKNNIESYIWCVIKKIEHLPTFFLFVKDMGIPDLQKK